MEIALTPLEREISERYDIQSAHLRPYEKHERKDDSQRVCSSDDSRAADDTAGCDT
jgi:hypothetical protein